MPPAAVRVGFIGTGRHATRYLYPALRTAPAHLVTICSRTPERVQQVAKEWGVERWYASYNEMLEREAANLDAVLVVGPPQLHYEAGLAVLQHGLHLFVDKPPAATLLQARELAQAAYKVQRQVMVGFNRRFSATWAQAQRILTKLGTPDHIELAFATGPSAALPQRLLMMDIHYLDAARYFCGEIAEMQVINAEPASNGLVAAIRFANGATGTLLVTDRAFFLHERIALYAGGQLLELDNLHELRISTRQGEHTDELVVSDGTLYRADHWNHSTALGYAQEMQHFCRAVQSLEPLTSTIEDGVAAMEWVERLPTLAH